MHSWGGGGGEYPTLGVMSNRCNRKGNFRIQRSFMTGVCTVEGGDGRSCIAECSFSGHGINKSQHSLDLVNQARWVWISSIKLCGKEVKFK